MSEVVKFPVNACSSCGAPTNQKIELLNFDTGENAGVKYLCPKCQPLDEDGLRLLLDKRDAEIAALMAAISDYLATFDRCGGSESVSAEEFAERRQRMRDLVSSPKESDNG